MNRRKIAKNIIFCYIVMFVLWGVSCESSQKNNNNNLMSMNEVPRKPWHRQFVYNAFQIPCLAEHDSLIAKNFYCDWNLQSCRNEKGSDVKLNRKNDIRIKFSPDNFVYNINNEKCGLWAVDNHYFFFLCLMENAFLISPDIEDELITNADLCLPIIDILSYNFYSDSIFVLSSSINPSLLSKSLYQRYLFKKN
jgi:hypothetical protein